MADVMAYVEYVDDHIQRVKQAWSKMKVCEGFPYRLDDTFKAMMDVLVENHDSSKFSDEELGPYANKFYPDEVEVVDEEEFQKAWAHHCRFNPHHWQWWVTPDGVRSVNPYLRHMYLCEMVCDWMAMGEAMGNSASSYYKYHQGDIILDGESRIFTELLLRVMEPKEWEE